jgi:Zn-dependent peptidase ImmA (M78 family)
MEGQGLIYLIYADKPLLWFLGGCAAMAASVAGYVIVSIRNLTKAVTESRTVADTKITKLETIMAKLASSLDVHEQRIRRCEMDIILVKAEAVRMQDFKRFEQQMEILGGEATAKAVVAFVKSEVKLKEQEVERIKDELQFGRRAND